MNWFDLDISHVPDHMCLNNLSFFIEAISREYYILFLLNSLKDISFKQQPSCLIHTALYY